jgi:hypothetical protein
MASDASAIAAAHDANVAACYAATATILMSRTIIIDEAQSSLHRTQVF